MTRPTSSRKSVATLFALLSSDIQCNPVRNDFGKLLDLVFSSFSEEFTVRRCLNPLVPESSYHPALHAALIVDSVNVSSFDYCNYSFNFCKADFSRLGECLTTCDWADVLNERNIDKALASFYDIIYSAFSRCIPIYASKYSEVAQPWLDRSLKHLKNLRSKAWRRFCSSGSEADYLSYIDLGAQFSSGLKLAYENYISNMASKVRNDPKSFWKFVNSKRGSDGYPSSLRLGDVESDDPVEIANLFADFFGSAFCVSDCDISFKDFTHLTKLPSTSLCVKDLVFDEASILECLAGLPNSFSSGPDGIPPFFLKKYSSHLVSVLCYLFNLSLSSGCFPKIWKYSLIFPLHKKGNKSDISNYRPVANLCHLAKILETLVNNVIRFHCSSILGPFQHGFTKGKSTTTNLLEFSHYCIPAIESGNQIDCIFTDFSKAFDRIDHSILLHKFSVLGFPAPFVDWLSSYLSNRTQRVMFRGALSSEIANSSGVPQGSILGPLLFIMFINDVSLLLSTSRILCYADDAKLFRVISNETDCRLLLSDLSIFHKWCLCNRLPLNIAKCSVMSFSRKKSPLEFTYRVEGSSLTRLDKTKDLGVILNCKFSFEDHINAIANKASSTLGFIKRWSKEFDDPYITRLLYCTFVRPILEYASPVWAPFYHSHIDRVEAVQRRFLRFALRGLPWADGVNLPPYVDRLKLISLDPLYRRREICRTMLMSGILQGSVNSPVLLSDVSVSVPPRPLRTHDFLHVPRHRTNYGGQEPISSMSRSFNLHFSCFDFNLSKPAFRSRL